jgi:hypothetical protein
MQESSSNATGAVAGRSNSFWFGQRVLFWGIYKGLLNPLVILFTNLDFTRIRILLSNILLMQVWSFDPSYYFFLSSCLEPDVKPGVLPVFSLGAGASIRKHESTFFFINQVSGLNKPCSLILIPSVIGSLCNNIVTIILLLVAPCVVTEKTISYSEGLKGGRWCFGS